MKLQKNWKIVDYRSNGMMAQINFSDGFELYMVRAEGKWVFI